MSETTIEDVRAAVAEMDASLSPDDETYKVATMLLAGMVVGADEARIAEFTHLDPAWMRPFAANLRASEVWVGDRTQADWFDEESGGVAFWVDVAVAQGLVVRST